MSEGEGAETRKKRGCGFWVLVVLGIIIGMAVLGAIFGEPPTEEELAARAEADRAEREAEAAEAVSGATPVTAMQLWQAFEQNEVAAQSNYGDRDLLVSGTIDGITLDFMDEPVVSLATGNQFQSVQLHFDGGDAAVVGQLSAGMQVTALCRELSEVAGTPMLDDCVLQ